MDRETSAVERFKAGHNCAQSVLSSFADRIQLPLDLLFKLSSGFGAGMGRKQKVCGAVTGGILVLNFLHGRGENDDRRQQDIIYKKVQSLMNRFEDNYMTTHCKKLLDDCDLLTQKGQELFKAQNMIEKCHEYVAFVVRLLTEMTNQ